MDDLNQGVAGIMGLNRLKEFWTSGEEPDQNLLFRDLGPQRQKLEGHPPRLHPVPEESRRQEATSWDSSLKLTDSTNQKVMMLVDKCLELVQKNPEQATKGQPINWDIWFKDKLLSTIRCAGFPLALKLRLLGFFALMLPFLDDKERERVRVIVGEMAPQSSSGVGEMLTEQDLIHTQWLVQAILRSNDILGQMQALKRSILRRVPTPNPV